jgi:hypothetical protein
MHVNLSEMDVTRLENLHVSKADWSVIQQGDPQVSEPLCVSQFLVTRGLGQDWLRCQASSIAGSAARSRRRAGVMA